MKTVVPWLSSLVVFAKIASLDGVRSRTAQPYFSFIRSTSVGVFHLAKKLCSSQSITVARSFRQTMSDESLFAAVLGHLEVVRIVNGGIGQPLTKHSANYANKYIKKYLASSFSKKSCREILKFHHAYLAKHVHGSFYHEILWKEPILWREVIGDDQYTVVISFNTIWHSEGDLSLVFKKNTNPLYESSFTIVPGSMIGCRPTPALLIGRVQGRQGETDAIRASTKACYDIAPPYLLLAAVQSIATVLGINLIAGVSNLEQITKSQNDSFGFYFDYDVVLEYAFGTKKIPSAFSSYQFHHLRSR